MTRGLVVVWFLFGLSPAITQNGMHFLSSPPQDAAAHSSPTTQKKIDPAKEADIRRFLELGGAKTIMAQTMDQMSETIKPMLISALPPGEYREKLVELFYTKFRSKTNLDELIALAVPIYDKYFTDEELKGLIKFYETPLGQKAVAAIPKLMGELSEAGQQWGRELGQQCMREVLAEHPDLAQEMEAAAKKQP